MPIIEIQQSTSEWHEWRYQHITATDAPVIMNSNPWKSKRELWEEKLGLKKPDPINEAMLRGQQLEPEARKLACEVLGLNFEPVVYVNNNRFWQGASLDGHVLLDDGSTSVILEIKCPKEGTHNEIRAGIIPPYYTDQVQHQLCVTEAQICYFVSYRPEDKEKLHIIEIAPNWSYHEQMIKKEEEFYHQLCDMNPPEDWVFKQKKR